MSKHLAELLLSLSDEGMKVEVFDFEDYMDKFCH